MLLPGSKRPLYDIISIRKLYHRAPNNPHSSTDIAQVNTRTFTTKTSYQQLLRTREHLPLRRRHAAENLKCLPVIADFLVPRGLRQSTSFSTTCEKKSADNGIEGLADGSSGTLSTGVTKVIKWSEVDLNGKEEVSIKNTKFIASYNTTSKKGPTIYVPGQSLSSNNQY